MYMYELWWGSYSMGYSIKLSNYPLDELISLMVAPFGHTLITSLENTPLGLELIVVSLQGVYACLVE